MKWWDVNISLYLNQYFLNQTFFFNFIIFFNFHNFFNFFKINVNISSILFPHSSFCADIPQRVSLTNSVAVGILHLVVEQLEVVVNKFANVEGAV